jgi:hypothetical protein
VPALIISWAYELTPEGLKREQDVVRDAPPTALLNPLNTSARLWSLIQASPWPGSGWQMHINCKQIE